MAPLANEVMTIGGIAHSLEQTLADILGRAHVALNASTGLDHVHAELAALIDAAERAGDVTRRLFDLAREEILARL
jgi:hypothetical protein